MRCSTDTESGITVSNNTNYGGTGSAACIVMAHRTSIAVDTGHDSGSRNAMTTGTLGIASEMGVRMTGMNNTTVSMAVQTANRCTVLDYILNT